MQSKHGKRDNQFEREPIEGLWQATLEEIELTVHLNYVFYSQEKQASYLSQSFAKDFTLTCSFSTGKHSSSLQLT